MLGKKIATAMLVGGTILVPSPAWADHDYDRSRCQGYDCREGGSGNEGEYRDDNRRAGISPGPFDRSPVDIHDNRLVICFPFSRCDGKDGQQDGDQPVQPAAGSDLDRLECMIRSLPYHCDPKP